MKKAIKNWGVITLLLFQMLLLSSCENINPINNSDDINAKHLQLEYQNEVYSMLEFAIDICEQVEGTGMPKSWSSLSLGKVASVDIKDSIFYDGDEIRFTLNLGDLSWSNQQGRGSDGRWRFGEVEVRIDKYFKEIGAQAELKFAAPFCNSTKQDHFFTGEIILTRIAASAIDVEIKSLKFLDETEQEIEVEGLLNYQYKSSSNMMQSWNNEFLVNGNMVLKYFDDGVFDDEANVTIESPLLRKLEAGCNNSPISGKVRFDFADPNLSASVDFDPFENQACDNFVRVSMAKKVFDYVIDAQ